ncbi:ATP synthase E chain [Olea europaea subsp. europaea]|uniref:ATP synthase E chain n=1 Tax=Olea europaea subsp. europaea TaxID=158383 RepID=A0A8S0RAJ6_OLEEU|nr:ATP synthase E chain [Olea europaea subsp. europaea]
MAPPPGPYSGTSTRALVARVSAFSLGLIDGNMKLKILRAKATSHKKAEAKGRTYGPTCIRARTG